MNSTTQLALLWNTLHSAQRSLSHLERELSKMVQSDVERFIVLYRWASWEVCYPWDGIAVTDLAHLSESSTEDFCDWIVSQGYHAWLYACAQDNHPAQLYAFRDKSTSFKGFQLGVWSLDVDARYCGYQSPFCLAVRFLQIKFNVDYWEHANELHDRYEPVIC